jgi:hypothetical protein
MAHKCFTRFDLKLKWVHEFSIFWVPCMNESNVNPRFNCISFVCWKKVLNDCFYHLQLSYYGESHKQPSLHKLYPYAIIYMNFGWLQSELVKCWNIFQRPSWHLPTFLQNVVFLDILTHVWFVPMLCMYMLIPIYTTCKSCANVNQLHLYVWTFYTYIYNVVVYICFPTLTWGQCKYLSNTFTWTCVNVLRVYMCKCIYYFFL